MDTKDLIRQGVELMGGPVSAAERLDVKSYQTVQQWIHAGRVPPKYAPTFERELNGEIICEQICPDVDWAYLRSTSPKLPA